MYNMSARDDLIQAAKRLLATQGFEATSPRQIQAEAGVGQGSFYHHFSGKADLARAALTELGAQMSRDFDDVAAPGGLDGVRAFLAAERDPLAGCRIGRMAMERSIAEPELRQPVAAYFRHLQDQLTAAFAEAGVPGDPAGLADLAIATVQGGYVLARATRDPEPMRRALRALLQLLQASQPGQPGQPVQSTQREVTS